MTQPIAGSAIGILLTAGRGSRMGGICKGRILSDGLPLVVQQLMTMAAAGLHRVVVVMGAQAELIASILDRYAGMLSSIQLKTVVLSEGQITDDPQRSVAEGLRATADWTALGGAPSHVFITLVDLPLLRPEHYQALWDYAHDAKADITVPRNGAGTPGHPILLKGSILAGAAIQDPDFRLRELIAAMDIRRSDMLTEQSAYFRDSDTAEDLAAISANGGPRLELPGG